MAGGGEHTGKKERRPWTGGGQSLRAWLGNGEWGGAKGGRDPALPKKAVMEKNKYGSLLSHKRGATYLRPKEERWFTSYE